MDRRTIVADAALEIVAAQGMKGLTHRAVDLASASPPGTTSNYFRTRAALIAAAVDRLEERDLALWSAGTDGAAAPQLHDAEALAASLAGYLAVLAGPQADLTRARLVLSLAEPGAVTSGHARFMAVARGMVEASGIDRASERARWLADYCDGVLLHQLTARRDEPFERVEAESAIRRLLA
jgi:DNA-binding transcriptional regulator YbjK